MSFSDWWMFGRWSSPNFTQLLSERANPSVRQERYDEAAIREHWLSRSRNPLPAAGTHIAITVAWFLGLLLSAWFLRRRPWAALLTISAILLFATASMLDPNHLDQNSISRNELSPWLMATGFVLLFLAVFVRPPVADHRSVDVRAIVDQYSPPNHNSWTNCLIFTTETTKGKSNRIAQANRDDLQVLSGHPFQR